MLQTNLVTLPALRLVDPKEYCKTLKNTVEKYAAMLARRMAKQMSWKQDAPRPLSENEIRDSRIRVYQIAQKFLFSGNGIYRPIPENQNVYIIHIDYRDIFEHYDWKTIRVGPDHNPTRIWFHDSYIIAGLATQENLFGEFYTDNVLYAFIPAEPTRKDPRTIVTYKRKKIITRTEIDGTIVLSQIDLIDVHNEIQAELEERKLSRTSGKYGAQLLQSIISRRNTADQEREKNTPKLTYSIVFIPKES